MSKEVQLEEFRTKVLETLDSLQSSSPFKSVSVGRIEYIYKLIDQIQTEGIEVVDKEKVVTDRFIKFLDAIAKDPANKTIVYCLIPLEREEFLTLKYPYKMKPVMVQANTKFYKVHYDLDNVDIAKIALTQKGDRHYIVEFFEFNPSYQSVGYLTDIIKDSLTREFGLTTFELSSKVFGMKGV